MITIGLIREGKTPGDNRVAFTPDQCKWIHKNFDNIRVVAQTSPVRCFTDREYASAGITVTDDMSSCDVLMGIKEVPENMLIPDKTYLFFSHTKKLQPHNRSLFHAILDKRITLIDYECLEHDDGQRILGFGFFAGVVGAHNGIMAFGKRTALFELHRVYKQKSFRELIHTYFGLKLPPVKIAVTGSGRVAHGILEIMNLLEVVEVDPDEYLSRDFSYPVFTQLKGADLYGHKKDGSYTRQDFHDHPENYACKFKTYIPVTDILMNGIYWDVSVPRLFELKDISAPTFKLQTISDITDDKGGSVPCNLGDATIEDPVYGVDRTTYQLTAPYLPNSIDVMAVGNLPNELPRDASRYFGEQLIKYLLEGLVTGNSAIIDRATMVRKGQITEPFGYMKEYGEKM